MTDGPLIVQSDKTLLLEVDHELAGAARADEAVDGKRFLPVILAGRPLHALLQLADDLLDGLLPCRPGPGPDRLDPIAFFPE